MIDPNNDWVAFLAGEFKKAPLWVQLLKLTEECGEVAEAYIGATGANPRKGYSHSHEDVRSELLDVAITALVAYSNYDYGNEDERAVANRPMQMLDDRAKACVSRSLFSRGISAEVIAEMGLPAPNQEG